MINKDNKFLKKFGKHFKACRKKKKITPTDLHNSTGLSRNHIYNIENGKASADVMTLKLVADVFGISLIELLTF